MIGNKYKVLIDDFDFNTQRYISRSYAYAPDDVDGCIYIDASIPLILGEIYTVEIKDADVYDLIGEVIDE